MLLFRRRKTIPRPHRRIQTGKNRPKKPIRFLGQHLPVLRPRRCKPAETAEIKRSGEPALPADYTRVNADKIEGQTQVGVRAEGDVIVERNADVLNADWRNTTKPPIPLPPATAFTLYQNGSTVSGDQLVYNLKNQTGSGTAVRLNTNKAAAFKVSAKSRTQRQRPL